MDENLAKFRPGRDDRHGAAGPFKRGLFYEHFEFCRTEHAEAEPNLNPSDHRTPDIEFFSIIIWTVSIMAFALGIWIAIRMG